MLEIFRVWHNWLWRSPRDGATAAERLGLATGEVREDHILGYDVRVAVERLWAVAAEAEASNGDGYTAAPGPVDKTFAMLRRRMAMFERPVSSVTIRGSYAA
jgi:hypothetical protein